jgi:hypothetical protein
MALAQDGAQSDIAYEAAIDRAVHDVRAGRLAEARSAFQHAHELKPSARTLRGLAAVEFELGHYAAADRLFRAALADARRPLTPNQRSEAEQVLVTIAGHVGRVRVDNLPNGAEVRVDGLPFAPNDDGTMTLDEGDHMLALAAPGFVAVEQPFRVESAGLRVIEARLEPVQPQASAPVLDVPAPLAVAEPALPAQAAPPAEPTHTRKPVWFWATVVGGSALTITGVSLFAVGMRDRAKVEDAKDGTSWSSIRDSHGRAPLLSGFGIATASVGLLAIGTGTLLWRRTERPSLGSARSFRIAIAPRAALLSGSF